MNGALEGNAKSREVHLQSMPWYHGPITRETAEELLQPREDGLFLIRESVNFPGDFTLCLCIKDIVEHYRIMYDKERRLYTVDEEGYFPNLVDLVDHYSIDADGLVSRLVKALPKAGPPIFPPVLHYFNSQGWVLPRKNLVLEERLGSGDFAEVFKAKYRDQLMAAKCVRQDSKTSIIGMKEAAVMTTLSHPNLVKFIGLVIDGDKIYLITEYMENGSLVNYLRTRGKAEISVDVQLSLVLDVLAGMAHLEEKGLVHRDLAARNVLLGPKLAAKVADFGLCREVDSQECSGKVPIKWTAPEAVRQNLFTSSSDVWSFGILLWEIYSFGRLPYLGISVNDVLREVESGYRLPPPNDTPDYICTIMQRSWSFNPEKRPSFRQVLGELRQLRGSSTKNGKLVSTYNNQLFQYTAPHDRLV